MSFSPNLSGLKKGNPIFSNFPKFLKTVWTMSKLVFSSFNSGNSLLKSDELITIPQDGKRSGARITTSHIHSTVSWATLQGNSAPWWWFWQAQSLCNASLDGAAHRNRECLALEQKTDSPEDVEHCKKNVVTEYIGACDMKAKKKHSKYTDKFAWWLFVTGTFKFFTIIHHRNTKKEGEGGGEREQWAVKCLVLLIHLLVHSIIYLAKFSSNEKIRYLRVGSRALHFRSTWCELSRDLRHFHWLSV